MEGVKNMKKFLKWFGISLAAFLAIIAIVAFLGIGRTERLSIQQVDLQQAPDGTYIGKYDGFRFTNIVNVTLKDHRIEQIDVIKTQRNEISQELAAAVIEEQSPVVDVVSGATLDHNAFCKAVEIALTNAIDGK